MTSLHSISPVTQSPQSISQTKNPPASPSLETTETPFSQVLQNQQNEHQVSSSTERQQRPQRQFASSSSTKASSAGQAAFASEDKGKNKAENKDQAGFNNFIEINVAAHVTLPGHLPPPPPNDKISALPTLAASSTTPNQRALKVMPGSSMNMESSSLSGTGPLESFKAKRTSSHLHGLLSGRHNTPDLANSFKKNQPGEIAENRSEPFNQGFSSEQALKLERSTAEFSVLKAQGPTTSEQVLAQTNLMKQLDAGRRTASDQEIQGLEAPDPGILSALSSFSNNPNSHSVEPQTPTFFIQAPAHTPEFREALATQVTVLAQDGVQEATLQLHPADLGPISVHIALDGNQARVEFAVDSPVTKAILEAGLSELASAMQNAGLAFAGGDVSQGRSGSRQDGGAFQEKTSGARPSIQAGGAGSAQATTVRIISTRLGGLDLYA